MSITSRPLTKPPLHDSQIMTKLYLLSTLCYMSTRAQHARPSPRRPTVPWYSTVPPHPLTTPRTLTIVVKYAVLYLYPI